MKGNRTYGRLFSTTIFALEDAERNASDMQNVVYHAKDIFEAFYTDDLSPDLMHSISKICVAAGGDGDGLWRAPGMASDSVST